MDLNFMETVWWAFKQLFDKGLIYRGFKIMPFSTPCGTPLSNFEASGEDTYKEVTDPTAYVKFKLRNEENTFFVAWTSTPWTLPSNLALCMNPNIKYAKVKDVKTNEIYILAEKCIKNIYPDNSKKDSKNKKDKKDNKESVNSTPSYEILSLHNGIEFKDCEYIPLFDFF